MPQKRLGKKEKQSQPASYPKNKHLHFKKGCFTFGSEYLLPRNLS
jgi:hypothetical protein